MALERYFRRLILSHIAMVAAGFASLFALFDFVADLDHIGRLGYSFVLALQVLALRLPGIVYETLPIASLIGALWALSALAASSEFTVARAGGFSTAHALRLILRASVPLMVLAAVLSEGVLPLTEPMAASIRSGALGEGGRAALRSGYWVADRLVETDEAKVRIVNIRGRETGQGLQDVVMYEFDGGNVLIRRLEARRGELLESAGALGTSRASVWRLEDVRLLGIAKGRVEERHVQLLEIPSLLPATSLSALLVKPEQMAAHQLLAYSAYLKEGGQASLQYEQAFWKKAVFPLVIPVMLLLALPSAYIQARGGTVGLKVFLGILAGVGFQLANSLFAHLGILGNWPPLLGAIIPSLLMATLAVVLLLRVQRHSI